MRKIFFIVLLIFVPVLVSAYTADDFTVNPQSIYAVPPGTTKLLILDLSLPEPIDSIKIQNQGTVQQYNITKLLIYQDGSSAGWDGDESEIFIRSSSPFWNDTFSLPSFSAERIFVTVDIASTTASERTIKPKVIIDDVEIIGLERTILAGIELPTIPLTPLAKNPEPLSASTIRWHFEDRSNNEFGFKILDENQKVVARQEEANLSYLDETGLTPDTEYSGRKIVTFNDRGESLGSSLAVFSAVRTLTEAAQEEVIQEEAIEPAAETEPEEAAEQMVEKEPSLLETIQQKIAEIQQQIYKLFEQLNELLEQQGANIWTAFQQFFQSLFGK